ncbi:class I SAM-dependent methyltransferase [Aliiroseovarius halocynthiae]|uniref:Class I SAM-dependent methyltransferase n=1 Tax=Aliiroseovarius halocynthiae TaxID=985055 RepID=A0A545SV02_9RHOB|nr:class I SAM-dependent methyltransferase [Aliiroseovarius halocynthiae]TQV68798.1 class I SAM-dependent methyltransferase [Aliiroseovarius halocynthiae]
MGTNKPEEKLEGQPTSKRPARLRMMTSLGLADGMGAEIGVFKGEFSAELLREVGVKKLFMIDPWENFDDPGLKSSWYHSSAKNNMIDIYKHVKEEFAAETASGQATIIRGGFEDACAEIADDELDFAYIDGDHRFEAVLHDLTLAAPKVKTGGFLIVDDYSVTGWWRDGVVAAMSTFLGRNPNNWMIVRCVGHQVAIKRLQ